MQSIWYNNQNTKEFLSEMMFEIGTRANESNRLEKSISDKILCMSKVFWRDFESILVISKNS